MSSSPYLCAGCQKRIGAQAVRAAGMSFHPQCYLCAACRRPLEKQVYSKAGKLYHEVCYQQRFLPRCGHCQQMINTAYAQDSQGRYHPACYTQLHQLFCSLCNDVIQGSYLFDHWGNKAHTEHQGHATQQCHVCARLVAVGLGQSRQLSDGRLLCQPCSQHEIRTFDQIQAAKLSVIQRLQQVGFDYIPDYVKVTLSEDQHWLNQRLRSSPTANIHGLTRTLERQIPGYGLILEHQIQVISGLPRLAFMGVMAHELLHVWIHEKRLRHLSHAQVEGFCNLGTALMLQQAGPEEFDLATVLLRRMAEDTDPAYGEGYRHLAWQLEQMGWPALLQALQAPTFVWSAPPIERLQAHREAFVPSVEADGESPRPSKTAHERLLALKQHYQQAAATQTEKTGSEPLAQSRSVTESEVARKVRERFAQKPAPKKATGSKLGKLNQKKKS